MMKLIRATFATATLTTGLFAGACSTKSLSDGTTASELTCHSCHGSTENDAPPWAPGGPTGTGERGVGAHQSHVQQGDLREAVQCDECHVVPTTVEQSGHVDPLPAEVTFGTLAQTGELSPIWDTTALTCSDTYCHGATLSGGVNTTPIWTTLDGSQVTCDSCHGNPPPEPHPQVTDCQRCHPETLSTDEAINVTGGKHIDGVVDLASECASCHGDPLADNAAPPVSILGSSDTSDITIGAHQSHMGDGDVRLAIDCSECHVVPEAVADEGHMDDSPAEVVFGTLATSDGLEPVFDREDATCANAYCHGASLSGGTNTIPIWTTVDGTQTECGTCHGAPPPPPHATSTVCRDCHLLTMTVDGAIDVAGEYHINGSLDLKAHPDGWEEATSTNFHGGPANEGLDVCQACHGEDLTGSDLAVSCDSCHSSWQTTCTFCHGGTDNTLGAPPADVAGEIATTALTVGAHTAHVEAELTTALSCSECHIVPTEALSTGHIDEAPAEVTFGALAGTGGADPEWNASEGTCSGVYCHGSFAGGTDDNILEWTLVGTGQAECGTCHDVPPPTGQHSFHFSASVGCTSCHGSVSNSSGTTVVTPELHLNAEVLIAPLGGEYDADTNLCTPLCHATESW